MAGIDTYRPIWDFRNCVIIVAHPGDETLWAGGTMLLHPDSNWTVVTVCRAKDQDNALKFSKAMEAFGAKGEIGPVEESNDMSPLNEREIQNTIAPLLPMEKFNLVITHSIWGEYTRNLRHEEIGKAVLTLRDVGRLPAMEIRSFAYEDGGGKYPPRHSRDADIITNLTEDIWQKKYEILTKIYGFAPESFEAKTAPRKEAFWSFRLQRQVQKAPAKKEETKLFKRPSLLEEKLRTVAPPVKRPSLLEEKLQRDKKKS